MSQCKFEELSVDEKVSKVGQENYNLEPMDQTEPIVEQQSCSYCGEVDPRSLSMCNGCLRWFCNGGHGTSGSHVILHLVKSKHRDIKLHKENPLGATVLECYVCRSTNVFSLGFMPSKEESVVVLVCREPCLHSKTLRELNWDSSTWQPLIEERRLLPWICKVPTNPCKKLTLHDITTLELSWGTETKEIEDTKVKAPPVPLHFEDGNHYMLTFSILTELDFQASEEQKKSNFEDVSFMLQKKNGGKYFFVLKQLPVFESGLHVGDAASISVKGSSTRLKGVILEIQNSQAGDEVVFETEAIASSQEEILKKINNSTVVNFQIEVNAVAYKRKMNALRMMLTEKSSLSAYLYFTIIGDLMEAANRFSQVDIELPSENLPNLNLSQENAVRTALKNPLTLIQGPPGTGKTSTSVAIVYHIQQQIQSQILVCAPSNVAVDHLTERIAETGLKVVRLQARYRDAVSTPVKHLSLDKQVEDLIEASSAHQNLKRLLDLLKNDGFLNDRDFIIYKKAIRKIEETILMSADVICCTCIGAADLRLEKMRFKHVLIDEATQATEPETLIPIVHGAKQVFLVGDHCQLRPVVSSLQAEKAGFRRSLFERLLLIGHRPMLLDVQYRMHPALSLFPSNYFYGGILQNGVTENQRNASDVFPWPDKTKPIFFYNSTGVEELGTNGSSYLNRAEAALAEKIVTKLIKNGGVNPESIGVITPYRSQCQYIKKYFVRTGLLSESVYDCVEVSSVDAFQGREKDFIILSCVRSNHRQGIGFVNDWRRLNVSITRAKRGMIIMGNVSLLSRYPPWHALLEHLLNMSLIVDGPIEDLVPSSVVLQKPRKIGEENELEEEPS